MPVITDVTTVEHRMHASTFTSLVAPSRGSARLCAWRLDVASGTPGVEHRVNREEVLYVLDGSMQVVIDGVREHVIAGQAVLVPAGAMFVINTDEQGVSAWVVTEVGLEATTADGAHITPPWAR